MKSKHWLILISVRQITAMLFFRLFFVVHVAKCAVDTMCEPSFNKCYKFVVSPADFFDADEQCIAVGGHLVSIKNAFENAIIGESAVSMFAKGSNYGIGANYILNNKWSWTDDTQWSYTNWMPQEPKSNEVVSVELSGNMWMSSLAATKKPYVCEYPSTKSCPTTTNNPRTCPTSVPKTCPTMAPIVHCDYSWTYNSKTNACYKMMVRQSFWNAESVCKEHGAHLVSIHSEEENIFVGELAASGVPSSAPSVTIIGLYESLKQWHWTDNSTVQYLNWGGSAVFGSCAIMYSDGYDKGPGWFQKWQGQSCTTTMRNFVCKRAAKQ